MRKAAPENPLFVRPEIHTPGAKGKHKSNEGIINVQTLNINRLRAQQNHSLKHYPED